MVSHCGCHLCAIPNKLLASSELPGFPATGTISKLSACNFCSTDGVDSAIANTASPPASCQAWANARQRITCPVPICTLASARIRIFPKLILLTPKLSPPPRGAERGAVLTVRLSLTPKDHGCCSQQNFRPSVIYLLFRVLNQSVL